MRIGIIGGTFDPPHFGHLNLAEEAKLRLNLNRILFVPAARSPFKPFEEHSSPLVRYRMIRLAVRNHPGFEVSDVDLRREPPSYTVDTLRAIQQKFPFPHELYLLAGADVLGRLKEWKDLALIFEMCCFVVATRPGMPPRNFPSEIRRLEINELDISSADIRRRIVVGEDINDLVPYKVLQLIQKEGLYR